MITKAIYKRVFHIKNGNATGTCFAIEKDHQQYVVTARHVVDGLKSGDSIQIYHENSWKGLQIKEIRRATGQIDVSIFSINIQLCSADDLDYTSDGLIVSQETYFLGFPYAQSWPSQDLNNNFPFPLVKKATISAIVNDPISGSLVILDGHNNPGFSGGPVAFIHGGDLAYGRVSNYRFRICSIISAYNYNRLPVYQNDNETDFYIKENTGIIISFNIKSAIDLIGNNNFGYILR